MPAPRRYDVASLPGTGPWTAAQLLELGWTRKAIRSSLESGRLLALARGVYGTPDPDPLAALVARCRAALLSAPEGAAISHTTACRLLQVVLPAGADDLIHLTSPGRVGRTHRDVRVHGSGLNPAFITEAHGLPVTAPARTAVDAARGRSPRQALAVLDSGARIMAGGLTDPWPLRRPETRAALIHDSRERLADALASTYAWPGTAVVADLLPYVDPCAESPLESTSRADMIASRLPMPELAWPVRGRSGRLYYADFAWSSLRVIGEADGWSKYGTQDDVRRALSDERGRQRDLEAAGWTVVRWDAADRTWLTRLTTALRP